MTTDAVIIVSAGSDERFSLLAPKGCKPLIPLNGRPIVSHLAGSLRECEAVSKVIVVGGTECPGMPEDVISADGCSSEAESVMTGIQLSESDRCLIMAGDMPLATADSVQDMLESAPEADVVYPVVCRDDVELTFPNRPTSYVRAQEGEFTGSSCLLVRREVALAHESKLMSLLGARKNPAALLSIVGPLVGLRLMMSTLAISEFEAALSRGMGLKCRVFITRDPEMLFSIDSPDDIVVAQARLGL